MTWEKVAKNAVYLALCAVFRLDPESEEALSRFIPAYEETSTTPQADRNARVCYYFLQERQSTNFDYTELSYARSQDEAAVATVGKNIPFTAALTFYGPKAYEDAEYFWSVFQIDLDTARARSLLRRTHIVPDGKPSRPQNSGETEGEYIRLLADGNLDLEYKEQVQIPYETVDQPPELIGFTEGEKPDPTKPEGDPTYDRWNQWGIFYQL